MNNIYDIARYRFATAQLNWTTAKLVLIAWAGPPDVCADGCAALPQLSPAAPRWYVRRSATRCRSCTRR